MAFLGKRPANVVVSGQLLAPGSVTEQNLQSGAVTVQKLAPDVNQAIANATPAGAVAFFAMNSAPTGWLKANGAQVSRSTYAALFNAIGTTYGAGDGSTTFNLPDLRGEFVRGLDDGRGVDTGRGIGTGQLDQMQQISGTLYARNEYFSSASGAFSISGAYAAHRSEGNFTARGAVFNSANSPGARTGTETRPRNVAMLACIKF